MAIRKRKPTSPGRRFQTSSDFSEITTSTPEKSLLAPKSKTGGRNNSGHVTAWHRGGGHKRRYRMVDFKRPKSQVRSPETTLEKPTYLHQNPFARTRGQATPATGHFT